MREITLFLLAIIYSYISTQQSRGRENSSGDYVNLNINRTIDLADNVIKVETKILIKSLRIDPIYTYKFPIIKNNTKSLVLLKATIMSTGENENITLKISPLREKNNDFEFYEFNFKSEPMNNEEERFLLITEHYAEKLEMLPKKISLIMDQLVVFSDSANHVSFYSTNTQQTNVLLPSPKTDVIDYTLSNATKEKGKFVYNFENTIAPLVVMKLRIHYENNKPFASFTYGIKIVEVSHWGNVAIEERYKVENIGATLEGEFGRVDYDEHGRKGGNKK
jgi:oligosaccharyltransferase complex subunit alpha (ribophorin I)